ncbi:MAG: ATP-binding cassette domain-containing protein [Chloroflexi bacterium]|nr:ATP-binding cassette domain-containing protein [Chloroflexota bacterium]
MSEPTVSIHHLCKSFAEVKAVADVSFDVYPGEIFGLLGPNGAGKTTTIRLMLDIFRPDRGTVQIFGGALTEAAKNRIGYMPEERGLYRDLKLEPTLVFLAMLKGLSEKQARKQLEGWLKRLDLWDHRQKKIQDLSRGMQQKAQIIATLVHEPDLIVVDEPFSGLDPVNTRLVKDIMQEQRQAGKTIIMSTHQMYQVEALCNRIVLIDNGRSVLYGEVERIKQEFTANAVIVEGTGDFEHLPGVEEKRRENGAWHLILAPGVAPQQILQTLVTQEGAEIRRFELEQPSLEDIFLATVQGGAPAKLREIPDA